jgi:hypothetical protein
MANAIRANSLMTCPVGFFSLCAISLAAKSTSSAMSRVIRISFPTVLMFIPTHPTSFWPEPWAIQVSE